ncbi:hypothetical protein KQ944_06130 [Bacillus subtilis]|uniref:hypothetical protein n=1 Tax=Pseudochrobactrum asaccharolyticum TaxID=354351 RepID=UPI001F178D8B|nr:hypothetical protein [Pseudochrobactrum asaccharolyticum]MCF7645736.1 hypothetical protein [Pseudochrobactrum asaccharolyticum]MCF7671199.1 hypothetical protein [Bacillus subtilis]
MNYMLLSILLSAILTLGGCSKETSASEKSVATDYIKNVTISGDASLIRLTTQDDQSMQAVMSAKPSGWLSGWFYNECKTSGDMVVTGQTLLIKARNNDWYDLSECSTDLQINLPRNASVTIDQPAFKADLQGQFSTLNIETRAADIALSGSAQTVKIRGDAFHTKLQFDDTAQSQLIDIAGRALDTSLHFPKGTAVSYRIHAKASMLDSKLSNTPDAKPEVLISGDYIHTEIR